MIADVILLYMNVFVSSQRVDSPVVQSLLRQLQSLRVPYRCSPRNPLDGRDPRWTKWYDDGLPAAIDWADVFVIAVDTGWGCSSWMGQESHLATTSQLPMYYWNPDAAKLREGGMREYLKEALPHEPADAVRLLQDRHAAS